MSPRRPSRWSRLDVALVAAILLGALGLKRFFSTAGVDELSFILSPTAWLVELVTGVPFTNQPGEGYMSHARFFVIAKPCAGINFFMVAACASVFAFVRGPRTAAGKLALAAGSVVGAFAATLVANALRIAAAIWLRQGLGAIDAATWERVHRVEGVVIYSLCLCLAFALARAVLARKEVLPC